LREMPFLGILQARWKAINASEMDGT
jgi:hypothetical protein